MAQTPVFDRIDRLAEAAARRHAAQAAVKFDPGDS
jgi:hypothetical protein